MDVWGMYGLGWLGMLLGLLIGVAILVGIILLIVWLARRMNGPHTGPFVGRGPMQFNAKEILQQRYARGEITLEQYREMLSELDR